MKTKKLITMSVAFLLAAVTLVGCAPAGSVVPERTTAPVIGPTFPTVDDGVQIDSYVVRTDNYYFDTGEYYYFFITFLQRFVSAFTEEQLKKIDLYVDTENNESLKDKKHPDGGSWYDFFRDLSLDYMTDLLLVCEAAIAENGYYTNDAQLYFDEQIKRPLAEQAKQDESIGSFENLILMMYGGAVSATAYSNALQKEYIYNSYIYEKQTALDKALTDADAEAFAATPEFGEEKDTSASRCIAYLEIDRGSASTNEAAANDIMNKFTSGEKTLDAFKALAEDEKLTFGQVDDIIPEAFPVADEWLFAEGRALGDVSVLKIDEETSARIVVFYFADGRPTYIMQARELLVAKQVDEWIASLKSNYKLQTDQAKLDGLNA